MAFEDTLKPGDKIEVGGRTCYVTKVDKLHIEVMDAPPKRAIRLDR